MKPSRPHAMPARQGGAALLMAMLVVALVATLAASALWQQWRSVEVEAAERDRMQARWILNGALDWARLILREDGVNGGPDHLGEPWALPLQEARLRSFLAVDKNNNSSDNNDSDDAFLSGQIVDMQARLNANNLVRAGQTSQPDYRTWKRLFDALGLPAGELNSLVSQLLVAADGAGADANAPLPPQRVEQLRSVGLSDASLERLLPYISWLPAPGTKLNLNTASATVIQASTGWDRATAQKLVDHRGAAPLQKLDDVRALVGSERASAIDDSLHSVASNFFEVQGRLRLQTRVVQERSLVRRTGQDVQILWRESLPAGAASQAPDADS